MAHPPRLTRSSSRCPRSGHWGICGTQQGREGTGSRTTNGFSLGGFLLVGFDRNTRYSNLPQHRLALRLAGTAVGHDRDAPIFAGPGNKAPWLCSLPGPAALLAPGDIGPSRVSMPGHLSLQVFALLFEKLFFLFGWFFSI